VSIAKPQEGVVKDVEHQSRLGAKRPLRSVHRPTADSRCLGWQVSEGTDSFVYHWRSGGIETSSDVGYSVAIEGEPDISRTSHFCSD
jgi:hypothetical protein